MKYVIRFETNWRPDERTLLGSGDYRVPLDMSDELAQRAIAEGVAEYRDAEPARSAEPAPGPDPNPEPTEFVMHTTKPGEPSLAAPKAGAKSKDKASQGKRRAVSD